MQILPATPIDALEQIRELMQITKKPREFKTFKKFRQDRDMKIKGLFEYIRNHGPSPGTRIKRSNGKTYEVQADGSFRRV
jgi:hypothetical protein